MALSSPVSSPAGCGASACQQRAPFSSLAWKAAALSDTCQCLYPSALPRQRLSGTGLTVSPVSNPGNPCQGDSGEAIDATSPAVIAPGGMLGMEAFSEEVRRLGLV